MYRNQGSGGENRVRSLRARLISASEKLILRLEEQTPSLTPSECFELFSALGELSFDDWSAMRLESRSSSEYIAAVEELDRRLARQWAQGHEELSTALERGIEERMEQIQGVTGDLAPGFDPSTNVITLTSYEFDGMLLNPLDELGFALEIAKRMGVVLSGRLCAKLSVMEDRLKNFLLRAFNAFEANGDPVFRTNIESFPTGFWWYRLPHVRSGERTG